MTKSNTALTKRAARASLPWAVGLALVLGGLAVALYMLAAF